MSTLIEINIILSIVFLGYYLFLRNLTFFQANRFYLIGGMFLALLSPYIKSKNVGEIKVEIADNYAFIDTDILMQTSHNLNYSQYLVWALSIIGIIFLLQFLKIAYTQSIKFT